MTHLLRWALTAALLVVVWRHAHWSVALSLALVFLGTEALSAGLNATIRSTRDGFKFINDRLKEKN